MCIICSVDRIFLSYAQGPFITRVLSTTILPTCTTDITGVGIQDVNGGIEIIHLFHRLLTAVCSLKAKEGVHRSQEFPLVLFLVSLVNSL